MAKNVLKVVAAVVLLLVGAAMAYAQETEKITADIPHAFSVAGKSLPAGRYDFQVTGQTSKMVSVRSADAKTTATAQIVTRITGGGQATSEPRLVFDMSGDQYVLAEVWWVGQDGALIAGFKNDAEHKHSTVRVTKK